MPPGTRLPPERTRATMRRFFGKWGRTAGAVVALAASLHGPGSAQTPDPATEPPYRPGLASPLRVGTYLAVVRWDAPWLTTNAVAMSLGDRLPLLRTRSRQTEWEIALESVALGQFDLDAPSFDFINIDFLFRVPVSVRRGAWSAQAALTHWSAHLGDEFLLRSERERIETSVESIEMVVNRVLPVTPSLDAHLHAGAAWRVRRVPDRVPAFEPRIGVEVSAGSSFAPTLRLSPLLAAEVRRTGLADVPWAWSARAGLMIHPGRRGRRSYGVLVHALGGASPHGQYFDRRLSTWGVGLFLR